MTMDDRYFTIRQPARHEIKVKGSRFIGECAEADSAERALDILEAIRRREHAATHHCYAWRVGLFDDITFKYSDDGEPSGTAGRPIYDNICGHDLNNILVVVTRYFGGTKLGTGGLARAYADTAGLALDQSGRRQHFRWAHYRLELQFPWYDQWLKLANRLDVRTEDSHFSEIVRLSVKIRQSRAPDLESAFVELTSGKGTIERIETASTD